MKSFILLYNGPATRMSDMTPEQQAKSKQNWERWMQANQERLTDLGKPMANGVSILDDGTTTTPADLRGYSIIEAADMDEALKVAKEHDFLSEPAGKFRIDIYELMSVPM